MDARQAKRDAHAVAARLIESYMQVGQPGEDCVEGVHGWTVQDVERLTEAFEQLADEHWKRSGRERGAF